MGKSLVIVESPAKARTIGKFLGPEYTIEASIGHIRDLPQGAGEIPEKYRGEEWSRLGVNVNSGFQPLYVVPREKSKQVKKLKSLVKEADTLYLATDEDREGEAISWHLCEVLKPRVPVFRLVFHEITKEAILDALNNPREVDEHLVHAQEARRILDRLYGYEVSPILWRKILRGLSAGRVQSVAVRLIAERERQRMAFVSATYWDLLASFAKQQTGESFQAVLVSVDGKNIPSGRDFDSATGKIKNPELLLLDEERTKQLLDKLRGENASVKTVDKKPYTSKPYPPFTTSTLQQEANRKLGFTARRTMQVAQSLYENGHITYMRTDSTNLADVAVQAARDLVASQYGQEYLPEKPRTYQTKVKNAQEAHEAIRPAGHPFDFPGKLRERLSSDEFRLYDLIWKRTIACQMANSRGFRTQIGVEVDGALFQVSGKTIEFPGYLRAYVEGSDDPTAELADREKALPSVEVGETLRCEELEPKSHTTQPPARYSEAALTRTLEEMGIGRPSTYASIIDTILAREYVFKKNNVLVPTWTAFAVARLLEEHFPNLVDYRFTAEMEDELDAISRGEMEHVDYLQAFYFGNTRPGLKQQLENKIDEIDPREMSRVSIGKPESGEYTDDIYVRVGRYGPFLEQGERRASIPDKLPPDELKVAAALELLANAEKGDEPLGTCPETGKPVYVKVGRFGPYVQRGDTDDEEKPKNASLLKGMEPEELNLETALKLLSLPRQVGVHPDDNEPIVAANGRYGPYIKWKDESRSLPEDLSPIDVTLEQSLELLAQPKARRGGRPAKKAEPLKVFDVSPVTEEPVRLLDGRYGPYVTDGITNASLPKTLSVEEVTLERALDLLAERAAKGTSRRGAKKKAAKKKATKKATKKKAAKKKTAKKKSAKKKAAKKKAVKKAD